MRALRAWLLACAVTPAWASHPLLTEDTDVLGKGVRELELHGERSREREAGVTEHNTDAILKLGYGAGEKVDVEIELRYLREATDGLRTKGPGDASLALKWRFFESDRLSLVVKPELGLPTGRDERGLGAGLVRWGGIIAAGYKLGRLELLANLAYLHNRNRIGERESLSYQSIAGRLSVTEKLRLVADLVRATDPDLEGGHLREIIAGITYELSERIDFGVGLKYGLNNAADDRALRAGLKLRW